MHFSHIQLLDCTQSASLDKSEILYYFHLSHHLSKMKVDRISLLFLFFQNYP